MEVSKASVDQQQSPGLVRGANPRPSQCTYSVQRRGEGVFFLEILVLLYSRGLNLLFCGQL